MASISRLISDAAIVKFEVRGNTYIKSFKEACDWISTVKTDLKFKEIVITRVLAEKTEAGDLCLGQGMWSIKGPCTRGQLLKLFQYKLGISGDEFIAHINSTLNAKIGR